jgi:hypothetical protein
MYYAAGSEIKRADLDGTDAITLLTGLGNPRDVFVDVNVGKMYWLEHNRIARANLDGSGVESLKTGTGFLSLAVDLARGRMYWGQGFSLFGANLDATGQKTLASGWPTVGIAVHKDSGLVIFAQTNQNPLIYYMELSVTDYNGSKDWYGNTVTRITSRESRATGLLAIDTYAGYIYYGERMNGPG